MTLLKLLVVVVEKCHCSAASNINIISLILGKPLGTISAVQMDFCHEGGGVETPVQMVWGSYLVNINHY